jgi:hypothetical protein
MLLLFVLLIVIGFYMYCLRQDANDTTPAPTSDSEQEEEADDSEGSLGVPVMREAGGEPAG